jgi:type I restriction enzyme S subunit
MAGEWKRTSLREAGVTLIDCDHRTPPASDSGYPYVAIPQLKEGRLALADARCISPEHFADWTRKAKPQHHDVILSRRCNPGETAFVPAGIECALGQNLVLLRSNGTKVFPPFLRWLLKGPDWWEQVGTFINVGAIFNSLKCADIPHFKMPLPPLAEQKAIASILGALDDKIELNRRMNATLEGMARALFQSWFVDFDPVRAKLDGRKPEGMDKATAALFPDAFEESSLGPIPKGWEVCSLAKKIELLSGGTPKTSEPGYWDGDIPWYSVKDSPSETDVWVVETEKCVTKLGIENSAAQILPEGTTIISARGTVGKLALIGTPMAINQSCYGVRGVKDYADYFTYYSLRQATADLQQRTHGTVFDTITRQTFETLDCIFPPAYLTQAFDRSVTSMMVKIKANSTQSRTLATLRDTLLPKLLSGELNVVSIPKVTK